MTDAGELRTKSSKDGIIFSSVKYDLCCVMMPPPFRSKYTGV